MSGERLPTLHAGIYRHYTGGLYQVLGYAHDANRPGRDVVVYIGLQVDGAHEGPRLAVRDALPHPFSSVDGEDGDTFFDIVHPSTGKACYDDLVCTYDDEHRRRFTYLGAEMVASMLPEVTETPMSGIQVRRPDPDASERMRLRTNEEEKASLSEFFGAPVVEPQTVLAERVEETTGQPLEEVLKERGAPIAWGDSQPTTPRAAEAQDPKAPVLCGASQQGIPNSACTKVKGHTAPHEMGTYVW